ncbi:MAG: type II CAAX prenyl endopeptidase Rce1 family protein [Haloferacaceae archaeon]
MSVRFRLRRRLPALTWVQRALVAGAVLGATWSLWDLPEHTLAWRAARDLVVFVVGPGALALAHGRHLGWRVDRRALRNTVALAAFVTPFYLVGSSLPTVRAYYPMWETAPALAAFLPHVVGQLLVVVAAETYYRGLLCVGVREIGWGSVFISPVVYALHHVGKPPIELLLSGPTDVLFGAVDYDAESILPSVVAHGLGLALLDWLVLHPPLLAPQRVVSWLRWLPVPL